MPSLHAKNAPDLIRVAFILFAQTKLIDVCGPLQVFSDARGSDGNPAYHVDLLSQHGGLVRTDTVATLPTRPFTQMESTTWDTVLVSGGSSAYAAARSRALLDAIGGMAERCRRLGSICLGAFVLAAGGHLDQRRATTHWEACKILAAEHPEITVVDDAIFVADGKVWTSAGVTSGIDMALAMVEDDLGRAESLRLAKSLVLPARRAGGQKQFSSTLKAQLSSGETRFAPIVAELARDPSQDFTVPQMAALSNMSERNFSRVFTEHMGKSPGRYVEAFRVERAAELIQQTDTSVTTLAALAGFSNAEQMRRAFQRTKGVSPTEYQAKFGRRTGEP